MFANAYNQESTSRPDSGQPSHQHASRTNVDNATSALAGTATNIPSGAGENEGTYQTSIQRPAGKYPPQRTLHNHYIANAAYLPHPIPSAHHEAGTVAETSTDHREPTQVQAMGGFPAHGQNQSRHVAMNSWDAQW